MSPQNDNGYDVANYREIDPSFGTMDELDELIHEAQKRNIGLMFDMVFNHTSTSHEWFQRAIQGEEKYQKYYFFKDGQPDKLPTNWQSKFGGPAWEYLPDLKKWYLHLFDKSQADLNWENPEVREELKDILRFWKNKGIKGFRFDVINLISKPEIFEDDEIGDGRRFYTDGRHIHDFLKELVKDAEIGDMITVGEMSSTSLEHCKHYTAIEEKELSMCFNFHHLKVDYKNGEKWELMKPDYGHLKELFEIWQLGMQEANGWNAVFWCNHDQPRIVSRFGNETKYWVQSAKMLGTAIHLMRGTPYIYQGEEIGMTNAHFDSIEQYRDVESLNYYNILLENGKTKAEAIKILRERSRDNSRTPMQWENTVYGGFSTNSPWIGLSDNYKTINVKSQQQDDDSIYNWYKKLIQLRKDLPVVSDGKISFCYGKDNRVLAYEREDNTTKLLVICNLVEEAFTLKLPENWKKKEVLLQNDSTIKIDDLNIYLNPFSCVVFKQ